MKQLLSLLLLLLLLTAPAVAQDEGDAAVGGGQVQIPVEVYNQLLEQSRTPRQLPRPAPASYALGSAEVTVTLSGDADRTSAEVRVSLRLEVLEDDWVLVPVLPAGTPVESVQIQGNDGNNSAVQLLPSPDGLLWSTQASGDYTMTLVYRVDASRSQNGVSLAVPLPEAASIRLAATLPGSGLDVAVIPSAGTRTSTGSGNTRVTATVPTARGVQISWRTPAHRGHAVSRASYAGTLTGDAVAWTGELDVELFSDETLTLPLLPRSTTLSQVRVDGQEAAILTDGQLFGTLVRGRGRHSVSVGFEVPVVREGGPPHITVDVPSIPVSRFELTLPGKKEVTVTAATDVATNVTVRSRGDTTVATAHVPMTGRVTLSWAEAVPEDIRTEVRANAGLYHAVWAEEGVMYVRALIDVEITRGETNLLRLAVPDEVQVNRITTPSGAVADWRIADGVATVFLDRQIRGPGSLLLEVSYDRSVPGDSAEPLEVPLLAAAGTQRQRGMVALLSSKDLTLKPVDEGGATRVGENQLPAYVRQAIEMTVAHTFKYVEDPPALTVEISAPERQQGRFDAQVDTLISLGEVALRGSASVEINVKSGTLMELDLSMPAGIHLLSLTGPSVRQHDEDEDGDDKKIQIQFTQEMEGQFRLEVAYEQILGDSEAEGAGEGGGEGAGEGGGETELFVPVVKVHGAEVEQGRLAIEALSAVEVQPSTVEQLSSLEISELPKQLVLRTTNPILQAYKYARSDPRLGLTITRHAGIEVLDAAIEKATYRTLFKKERLAVTQAEFLVRNSGKQFLRIALPPGSEVWEVFVDGRQEKPARAAKSEDEESEEILIKIINSTEGFPVELIYQWKSEEIGGLWDSSLRAELPRPDILVTDSEWEVYLPADVRFLEPDTNMDIRQWGVLADPNAGPPGAEEADRVHQAIEPLRHKVPFSGRKWVFGKHYANQKDGEAAYFEIGYTSDLVQGLGGLLSGLGAVLVWTGLGLVLAHRKRRRAALLAAGGLVLILAVVLVYNVSVAGPVGGVSIVALLVLATFHGRKLWGRFRSQPEGEDDED